ncbi:hypothetical protein B0H10DRAFT_1952310 [Mycena sp. CBHHK59/15]|nr:hypothetical protein B0H10DRAFT_1952310 [Mycena sp. CBHHK59/15]
MCASTDAMFAPAPNILKHRGHVEVSSRRSAACSTVLGVEEGRKLVVQLVQREIGGRMREHSAAQNEPVVGAESPTRRGCGRWRTIVDREKRNTCSFPIWGGLAISVSDPEIRHPLHRIVANLISFSKQWFCLDGIIITYGVHIKILRASAFAGNLGRATFFLEKNRKEAWLISIFTSRLFRGFLSFSKAKKAKRPQSCCAFFTLISLFHVSTGSHPRRWSTGARGGSALYAHARRWHTAQCLSLRAIGWHTAQHLSLRAIDVRAQWLNGRDAAQVTAICALATHTRHWALGALQSNHRQNQNSRASVNSRYAHVGRDANKVERRRNHDAQSINLAASSHENRRQPPEAQRTRTETCLRGLNSSGKRLALDCAKLEWLERGTSGIVEAKERKEGKGDVCYEICAQDTIFWIYHCLKFSNSSAVAAFAREGFSFNSQLVGTGKEPKKEKATKSSKKHNKKDMKKVKARKAFPELQSELEI